MPIEVKCRGCGGKFQAKDSLAGKRVKCPKCAAVIEVIAGSAAKAGAKQPAAAGKPAGTKPSGEQKVAPAPPPQKQAGAKEIGWFVLTTDEEQVGPMSKAKLDSLVASQRLDTFCRVRRADWDDWKWAGDVYKQLAPADEPEVEVEMDDDPAAAADEAALQDAQSAEPAAAGGQLIACPDCGKMVSRRAGQCPNCGGPVMAGSAASAATMVEPIAAPHVPTPEERKAAAHRKHVALIAGSIVGMLLFAAVAVWVVLQMLPAAESPKPAEPPQAEPPAQATTDSVSPEVRQQWMDEAATTAAKQVDEFHRQMHELSPLIAATKDTAELYKQLAKGNLDAIPDEMLSPPTGADAPAEEYKSKFDKLHKECMTYLEENVAEDESDQTKIQATARLWSDEKQADIPEQLKELMQ